MKSLKEKSVTSKSMVNNGQQNQVNKDVLYNYLFSGKITLSEYWMACKA
ncbi:MAG: hypothetical protein ABIN95_01320 [Mucilaginibacter sp.]